MTFCTPRVYNVQRADQRNLFLPIEGKQSFFSVHVFIENRTHNHATGTKLQKDRYRGNETKRTAVPARDGGHGDACN